MKKPKAKAKPVKKLAGKIVAYANAGTVEADCAAFTLAAFGRTFTEAERMLYFYYWLWREVQKIESGKKTIEELLNTTIAAKYGHAVWTQESIAKHHAGYKQELIGCLAQLCGILMNAVNDRDAAKLFELGKAVKFLKTFKPEPAHGDVRRLYILTFGELLRQNGEARTLKQWARTLNFTKTEMDAGKEGGFAHLNRLLKALKAPIAPAPKGRPKKPTRKA